MSNDSDVASIECYPGRSYIPFCEPGIIFGGETCYLETHQPGVAWLMTGNIFNLSGYIEKLNRKGKPDTNTFPAIPDGATLLIKLNVLPKPKY